MNFKVTMLTGAALAVMAGGAVLASPAMAETPVPVAASYADLLEPVPDAAARIEADDQAMAQHRAMFQDAQWGGGPAYHHHHHHHHHSRSWYRHHGYSWQNGAWFLPPPPPPPMAHHHHHHHHHHYWW